MSEIHEYRPHAWAEVYDFYKEKFKDQYSDAFEILRAAGVHPDETVEIPNPYEPGESESKDFRNIGEHNVAAGVVVAGYEVGGIGLEYDVAAVVGNDVGRTAPPPVVGHAGGVADFAGGIGGDEHGGAGLQVLDVDVGVEVVVDAGPDQVVGPALEGDVQAAGGDRRAGAHVVADRGAAAR